MTTYTLSGDGAAFIAGFEGTVLHTYNDPSNNCTIGIGHLLHKGPCHGNEGYPNGITTEQAYALLIQDAEQCATCVSAYVTVPLNQHQADALISFTYNIGITAFLSSDLLALLNQGNYTAVPTQLLRWVHANGVELPGLVTRRTAEGKLFMTPDTSSKYQQQSARDCWQSTAHLFNGLSPSYTSGIAAAWQALYFAGKKPGPPLTAEYGSVDWNGKAIRVQEFANTRCEWDGTAHWFPQL